MSRIASLPRRDWRAVSAPYSSRLSAALRWEARTGELRPAQVAGLLEAPRMRGLFMNGRVGVGKTLAAGLLPEVLRAKLGGDVRALYLSPGGILKDAIKHLRALGETWRIAPELVAKSYTAVSNMPRKGESLADLFGGRGPNLIICDEAHWLRKVGPGGSALANQLNDWMVAHPETIFCVLTGTCDVEGLVDYGHLLDWALRDQSPLPRSAVELQDWSEVIDQGDMTKAAWICQDLGISPSSDLDAIRAAFRERLHSAPGVIIDDTPFDGVPLSVAVHVLPLDERLEPHFVKLRTLWQRPDGFDVVGGAPPPDGQEPDRIQGSSIWNVARRMARGLCYICDPRPPEVWTRARRAYFAWVRAQLASGRFMTEAVARDWAAANALRQWLAWSDLADSFRPSQRTLWLGNGALQWARDWGAPERGGGVIWTDDVDFGRQLSTLTGWPYFGQLGRDADGRLITDAPRGSTVIASRTANGTGRNLQFQWNRCLFMAPPSKSFHFEQAVGRFFREGVETWADRVHVDVILACAEDVGALANLRRSGNRTARSAYSQIAARVDWSVPELPESGAAWGFTDGVGQLG